MLHSTLKMGADTLVKPIGAVFQFMVYEVI